MKKVEMIIKPESLEDVKETLNKEGIKGITVTSVLGCGNQKGRKETYRGVEVTVNLLPKVKVEAVVPDEAVPTLIEKVSSVVRTGSIGDGKIFIYNIEEAVRIRTGEDGEDAL